MMQRNFIRYMNTMEEIKNIYVAYAEGKSRENIAEEQKLDMGYVTYVCDQMDTQEPFYSIFAEVFEALHGYEVYDTWNSKENWLKFAKKTPEYKQEKQLSKMHGKIMGVLRLLYGEEAEEVRPMVTGQTCFLYAKEWYTAAVRCGSLDEFVDYISEPRYKIDIDEKIRKMEALVLSIPEPIDKDVDYDSELFDAELPFADPKERADFEEWQRTGVYPD